MKKTQQQIGFPTCTFKLPATFKIINDWPVKYYV